MLPSRNPRDLRHGNVSKIYTAIAFMEGSALLRPPGIANGGLVGQNRFLDGG